MLQREKKAHTRKALIIGVKRFIIFWRSFQKDKTHDMNMLKTLFPPDKDWFSGLTVRLDSGFQGFKDVYQAAQTYLPPKRKRGTHDSLSSLTEEQKEENRKQASERVSIEHAIGGAKRYYVIQNRMRYKRDDFASKIAITCARLWNFFISYT